LCLAKLGRSEAERRCSSLGERPSWDSIEEHLRIESHSAAPGQARPMDTICQCAEAFCRRNTGRNGSRKHKLPVRDQPRTEIGTAVTNPRIRAGQPTSSGSVSCPARLHCFLSPTRHAAGGGKRRPTPCKRTSERCFASLRFGLDVQADCVSAQHQGMSSLIRA
jgi:hypothetical protein